MENIQIRTQQPYIQRVRDPNKIRKFIPFLWTKERQKTPKVQQMQLQLTDICNLDCYFCSYGDLRVADTMSPEMVRRSLEIFDPQLAILTGGGDPSIYLSGNYRLGDAVADIGDRQIGMITNGIVIPEADWYNFEWVRISVDADDAETYKAMKDRDAFDRVIENIPRYCELPIKHVGIGMLLDTNVVAQLPGALQRYYALWQQYPKLNVQIRTIRDSPDTEPSDVELETVMNAIMEIDSSIFGEFLEKATNFYEWAPQATSMLVNDDQQNQAGRCYMPYLEVVIRPNGDIYPCDNTPQRDPSKKIGNVMDDLEVIAARQKELYEGIVPRKCFGCRYDSMNRILGELGEAAGDLCQETNAVYLGDDDEDNTCYRGTS